MGTGAAAVGTAPLAPAAATKTVPGIPLRSSRCFFRSGVSSIPPGCEDIGHGVHVAFHMALRTAFAVTLCATLAPRSVARMDPGATCKHILSHAVMVIDSVTPEAAQATSFLGEPPQR